MGDAKQKAKAKEEQAKAATRVEFDWIERAILILLCRNIQVQTTAKIRAASRTLGALEGNDSEWESLTEADIIGANAADLAAKQPSIISLTGEMVDFLLQDVIEKVGMRGIIARRMGKPIDKLMLVKSGDYHLPGEDTEMEEVEGAN